MNFDCYDSFCYTSPAISYAHKPLLLQSKIVGYYPIHTLKTHSKHNHNLGTFRIG